MSFQDKLKPIATSTPARSFESKLKPISQSASVTPPPAKPSFFDKFKQDIVTPVVGTAAGLSAPGRTIQNLASKGVDKLFGTQGFGAARTKEDAARSIGLDPESKQFKTSAFVGEAGTYMAPGSAATKATQGAGILSKMLVSGGTDAGVQALNAGEVDGKTLATGLVGGGATGAFSTVGKLLQKSGDSIMNSLIKPNAADARDGFSMETIKKYDLGGPLHVTQEKTEQLLTRISKELSDKLADSKNTVDLADVYRQTANRLTKDKVKTFGTNSGIGNALDSLKGEIDTIGNNVSIPDANIVKRATGQYGAWTYGRQDADTAKQAVYNVFYNELKNTIEKNSPDGVRELNKQLSELIPVQNAVIRRIPAAERNMPISLTDVIALSSSAIDPSALGVLALTRAQKSGTVGNLISKTGSSLDRTSLPLGVLSGGSTGLLLSGQNDNSQQARPSQ